MNINLDISGSKDVIYVDEQDTSTSIVFYIKDNGSAVDLTGLTLSFVLHRTSYIVAPLTITSASSGIATLTLTSAMTVSPGTLAFEVVGMESDDTPEFDISSYMVVQKVYSGSDGQNDPDEENPGIDVLYGEDAPDDDDDGEDKDFYFIASPASGIITSEDAILHQSAQHPMSLTDFVDDNGVYSFTVNGNPLRDGVGEQIDFPLHKLVVGKTYTLKLTVSFDENAYFKEQVANSIFACATSQTMQDNRAEVTYTIDFVYTENGLLTFGFYRLCDGRDFSFYVKDMTITGDYVGYGELTDLYNKHDGHWKKYIPSVMVGATSSVDGAKGVVPQPLIADREKFLKGDGTWAHDELSKLTDFEITDLADGNVPKWDGTAQKWVNGHDELSKLADFEITDLADGDVPKWDSTEEKWINGQGGGGASAVSDLTDVNLTNLADGEILKYDATNQEWINAVEGGGGGSEGSSMVFQHASWITSTSSSSGTNLTNALTLQKGRYLIIAHTPLTNVNTAQLNKDFQFCLKINNSIDTSTYRIFNEQYGECAWLIDLAQNSTVILCAGMNTSKTWVSQYLNMGGIDAILLSQNDSPIIYSTEEQEIGVWVDNKPLYQKTVQMPIDGDGSHVIYPHSIANVDKIWIADASFGWFTDDTSINVSPYSSSSSDTYANRMYVTQTDIEYIASSSWDGITAYITLLYTKTTDVAGSGTYSTFGEYMVHYSSTEKVIGTWTDGKPLYQKTIEQQWTTRDNTTLTINGIDNTMIVRDFRGVTEYKDGTAFYPLGMNGVYTTYPLNAYNSIRVNTIYGSSVQYVFRLTLTIIYTKTTD